MSCQVASSQPDLCIHVHVNHRHKFYKISNEQTRHYGEFAPLSPPYPQCTLMWVNVSVSSALGRVIVKTPLWKEALISAVLTATGSRRAR